MYGLRIKAKLPQQVTTIHLNDLQLKNIHKTCSAHSSWRTLFSNGSYLQRWWKTIHNPHYSQRQHRLRLLLIHLILSITPNIQTCPFNSTGSYQSYNSTFQLPFNVATKPNQRRSDLNSSGKKLNYEILQIRLHRRL